MRMCDMFGTIKIKTCALYLKLMCSKYIANSGLGVHTSSELADHSHKYQANLEGYACMLCVPEQISRAERTL